MDKKLVEEYLNKNSHIVDEKVVVKSVIDYGYDISANITWETEEALHENNVTISLFDLMVFIYSKIQ